MRDVILIGFHGCSACDNILESSFKPLMAKYPNNVSVHYDYDEVIERVNRRSEIRHVPLIVVENHGREDFRYCGKLSAEELEAIVNCERQTLTFEDLMGGAV